MAREYKFELSIGLVGCSRTEVIDVADELGMTDEEFDETDDEERDEALYDIWKEWHVDFIEISWEKA